MNQFLCGGAGPGDASHEGFADIVALFQHFTYRDPIIDMIRKTGGLIYRLDVAPEVKAQDDKTLIQAEIATSNPPFAENVPSAAVVASVMPVIIDAAISSGDVLVGIAPNDTRVFVRSAGGAAEPSKTMRPESVMPVCKRTVTSLMSRPSTAISSLAHHG